MSGTDYTTTPNLGLYKPVYDQDAEAWGTHLNANADVLDGALATSGASAKFLPLSGGTMLGGLTLAADPSTALGAVTKQYADAHLFTDAANDAGTYGRHANAWSAVVPISGAAMTGLLTLSGAPSATLHAANKGYVDTAVATYLPLAGGVLTGALTPSQTAGIVGTTTNNNAQPGSVGEYVSSLVVAGSAVPLANNVGANVTSISLTAGDWDVRGDVSIQPAATTPMTNIGGGINTVSLTMPAAGAGPRFNLSTAFATGIGMNMSLASFRLSIAATTTVYLVVTAAFTVSTCVAFGYIGARRIR
jgi:hypothetical protein